MSITLTGVTAGYGSFHLQSVDVDIRQGSLTALIGPNGCGKSTLLKAVARQLSPGRGRVCISGQDIAGMRSRDIARQVAVLPQHPVVPPGIRVEQLVGYGRAPHQNLLGFRTREDQREIDAALEVVDLTAMREKLVDELSGGQRQRAFVAMCIAQNTPYVLFDEPTSFLDIKHQYEVLELMAGLHAAGKTVVAVLHDIAQAARFATDVVVMDSGRVASQGTPDAEIRPELIADVYGLATHVYADPVTGTKVVTPMPKRRA